MYYLLNTKDAIKSDNSHLLCAYFVQGTVLRVLHGSSHLTFKRNSMWL